MVKRAFVPKRGAFSFFDYKAIEPRLTAYFASQIGYPEFAEQIRAGVDAYTAVARMVTGKESITDDERNVWKRVFLGILYGAGVKRVHEVWFEETKERITLAEAKNIVKTFHTNWPAVRALQDRVLVAHQRRGYIIGIDGRHLHLEEHGEHKLLNKLIQGSAAGLIKQAILNVHGWLRDHQVRTSVDVRPFVHHPLSKMVSVVHDELIFDGPTDELEILHVHIPKLMVVREDVHEIVPILVDHEVSTTSWADKVSYDEWRSTVGEGNEDARVVHAGAV